MTLQSWARDLASNYRSAGTRSREENRENMDKADHLLFLAYKLDEKEKFDATFSPR